MIIYLYTSLLSSGCMKEVFNLLIWFPGNKNHIQILQGVPSLQSYAFNVLSRKELFRSSLTFYAGHRTIKAMVQLYYIRGEAKQNA